VLLDTRFGSSDDAAFAFSNGSTFAQEGELTAPLPDYWEARENPSGAGVHAVGTLLLPTHPLFVEPDRVAVGNWQHLKADPWDFAPQPVPIEDGAVAVWWESRPLDSGQTRVLATYYGLGRGEPCAGVLPYSLDVQYPATLNVDQCYLDPNPFPFTVELSNTSAAPITGARLLLELPLGLERETPRENFAALGDLAPGSSAQATWMIRVLPGTVGNFALGLTVAGLDFAECPSTWPLTVPPFPTHCTPSPTPLPPTATPTPVPPLVRMAGYEQTNLDSTLGGRVDLGAEVVAGGTGGVSTVELAYRGVPTGLLMNPSTGFDYVFDFSVSPFALPSGRYLLEIIARDANGSECWWPYLEVTRQPVQPAPGPEAEALLREYMLEPAPLTRPAVNDGPWITRAGWYESRISTTHGGRARLVARVLPQDPSFPVQTVEMHFRGNPTGIFLYDDGNHDDFSANDGIYGIGLDLPPGVAPGRYLLELLATDAAGRTSALWPYLEVPPVVPTVTPTITPTTTPTPRPTSTPTPAPSVTPQHLFPCFTPTPQAPVVIVGEYFCLDAACTYSTLPGPLEYLVDFGDGTTVGWQSGEVLCHTYLQAHGSPLQVVLWVRNTATGETAQSAPYLTTVSP
jgi:hypothetical protein